MTKEYFIWLAGIVRDLRRQAPNAEVRNWLDLVVVPTFCAACRRRNPKFSDVRFMKAVEFDK